MDYADERPVFPPHTAPRFTVYRVGIRFRDRLVGGVPNDPKAIEGWIATKTFITDEQEQADLVIRTLNELGIPIPQDATRDEIRDAVAEVAQTKHAVGFKADARGAYLESRCVKAAFKENTNILFAGQRWGKREKGSADGAYGGKGPKAFVAERVFVWPDRLYFGPDAELGQLLFTGHTTGPKGPQSTLTYYQYCERPRLDFDVLVTDDSLDAAQWRDIWYQMQENGIGALRSQGYGRFDVVQWAPVPKGAPLLGGETVNGAVAQLAPA